MADQVSPHVLSMPLSELRERVELAERLAIANRFASTALSSGTAAAASAAGAPNGAQQMTAGKTPDAAGKPRGRPPGATAQKAPPAPPAPPPPPASDDFTMGDEGSSGGDDFSMGDGGDMLDGFVEEMTPDQAKAGALEIAKKVIDKKDVAELTTARSIMQKYGVSKVSDIPEDRSVEAYGDFKVGFPQYAT